MRHLWATPLPGVLVTVLAYDLCVRLHRRAHRHALSNPVASAIVLLVILLKLLGGQLVSSRAGHGWSRG